MGGKGNAKDIISILEDLIAKKKWKKYFKNFDFPYGFYDEKVYKAWLKNANLKPDRIELIPKDMSYNNKDGLAGWIRTTWLPYTDRIPELHRNEFIDLLVEKYIEKYPLDPHGNVHVKMVRLEVEAKIYLDNKYG